MNDGELVGNYVKWGDRDFGTSKIGPSGSATNASLNRWFLIDNKEALLQLSKVSNNDNFVLLFEIDGTRNSVKMDG